VVVGGWVEEEEEGRDEQGVRGRSEGSGGWEWARQESAVKHADKNKGDHGDQSVSLWMPSAIELGV